MMDTFKLSNYAAYDNFGLFKLNIYDAARLVVVDMWFMGFRFEEIAEPKNFGGSPDDPSLLLVLSEAILDFENKLTLAIDGGKLPSCHLQRDFDDNIIKLETLIDYDCLIDWLNDRGYQAGDAIAEWLDKEASIHNRIAEEVSYLRSSNKNPDSMGIYALDAIMDNEIINEPESLKLAVKGLVVKNKELEVALLEAQNNKYQPEEHLHIRRKKTYLKIIAAMLDQLHKGAKDRGLAKTIEEWTDNIAMPIDEDTIKGVLHEIEKLKNLP